MDIREILYSLVFCFVDGNEVEIVSKQDDIWTIRSSRPLLFQTVKLALWNLELYAAEEFECEKYQVLQEEPLQFYYEYKVKVKDEMLNKRFSELERTEPFHKEEQDEIRIHSNMENQIEHWLQDIRIQTQNQDISRFEIAYAANSRKEYADILRIGARQMIHDSIEHYKLSQHPLFRQPIERLYLGNEFCRNLLPDRKELACILKAIQADCLKLTFSLPYVLPEEHAEALRYMDQLVNASQTFGLELELVVNDFGSMYRLGRLSGLQLSMGRLLNRIKKDPRLYMKKGLSGMEDFIRQNNLDVKEYEKLLGGMRIDRMEGEDFQHALYGGHLKKSIHFPFYQISTSSSCPFFAEMQHGTRKKTGRVSGCPQYCESYVMLYDAQTRMLGYGNSIFGFSTSVLSFDLPWTDLHADRLVFDMVK